EQSEPDWPEAASKEKAIKTLCIHLQLGKRGRVLALFERALDSPLRGCELAHLCVRNIAHGDQIGSGAMIMGRKTADLA
ncbi:MAG TPA: hypothetical protein VN277_04075, partial [Acidiferrobacterales bacterium]|nr:hypothetical protein [Acidiferrobacterales bacterium]